MFRLCVSTLYKACAYLKHGTKARINVQVLQRQHFEVGVSFYILSPIALEQYLSLVYSSARRRFLGDPSFNFLRGHNLQR